MGWGAGELPDGSSVSHDLASLRRVDVRAGGREEDWEGVLWDVTLPKAGDDFIWE